MEPLQPASITVSNRRLSASTGRLMLGVSLAFGMLAGLSGCLPEMFTVDSSKVVAIPCQMHTRWEHQIQFPGDTTNNGKPTPVIAGRVYLFPTDLSTPVLADGTLGVYLYNDMPNATEAEKEMVLEEWWFPTKLLRQFQRRDAAGWGYTVMLPWSTYKPEITHVRLKVRFDRIGATSPLYSDTIAVTFETQPHSRTEIAHTHSGAVLPKNGDLLVNNGAGQLVVPANGAGQFVLPTNGQPLVLPPGQPSFQPAGPNSDNSGSGETTITKSPPPVRDNVPFIVPSARQQ